MTGSRTLPWRYACPAERHQGLKRRSGGVYCQSCGRTFDAVIDLKDGVAVSPTDAEPATVCP